MKFVYTLFIAVLAVFFLLNNAAGPGLVQDADRTGSPLSTGSCGQAGCHSQGSFSPSISVELLDEGNPVTQYEPGESYDLKVTLTAGTGTPPRYGFQVVALGGAANDSIGTFGSAPAGFRRIVINNRRYVEHASPRPSNTLTVEWTAPDTGEVRFYAAGIAANANGSNNGDGAATLGSPLVITRAAVSTFTPVALLSRLAIAPNPVENILTLRAHSDQTGEYLLRITSLGGQVLHQSRLDFQSGENMHTVDVNRLPAGVYVVQITDGERVSSAKLLKAPR
ncbi:MAG: T9SS type A sorting domain-containing protein [Saprospiraceae bacterium]|nr:T9SS type A sorting domain-containing protein [Saprospiraceae bacterium]